LLGRPHDRLRWVMCFSCMSEMDTDDPEDGPFFDDGKDPNDSIEIQCPTPVELIDKFKQYYDKEYELGPGSVGRTLCIGFLAKKQGEVSTRFTCRWVDLSRYLGKNLHLGVLGAIHRS